MTAAPTNRDPLRDPFDDGAPIVAAADPPTTPPEAAPGTGAPADHGWPSDADPGPAGGTSGTSPSAEERATREQIFDALSQVYDPEIGIDIVSLGLVYDVDLGEDGTLRIDMTLTSPYCPLGGIIQTQAHAVCAGLPGVRDVRVNLVWNPPWDPRTMASEEAKLELGIF